MPVHHRPLLAAYAKLVVLSVFALIFAGGLVTSWGAGMAAPDWPLSYGSVNPAGWWSDFPLRLEHGHRLIASSVGVLTLLLCAWTWRNRPLMVVSGLIATGLVYSFVVPTQHAPRSPAGMMHASLWVAGIIALLVAIIAVVLFTTSPPGAEGERTIRWIVLAAFLCVCIQATLGGLRVAGQTSGALDLALVLRIFHGCVAQAFLCLVVSSAAVLSPRWQELAQGATFSPGLRRLAWFVVCALFVQLILGAAMRHRGAGLVIPTFPAASPTGSWLPAVHNADIDTNFTHTRVGALLILGAIFDLAHRVFRAAKGQARLVRPAATLLALVLVQVTLGVLVVLHLKPPTLTTFHVTNGAALLATALLLALRLRRAAALPEPSTTPAA